MTSCRRLTAAGPAITPIALAALVAAPLAWTSSDALAQRAAPVEELRLVEEERARVEFQLRRLNDRETQVLEVLEAAERDMQEARTAADLAREQREHAEQAAREAEAREAELAERRAALARAMGPRLLLRYRLGGDSWLRALVESPTLADYLWRKRMVDRLLAGDLELARRLESLEKEAESARQAVAAERQALAEAEKEARSRAREAALRRQTQQALLDAARTEHALHKRTVDELERSRRRLLEAIADMPSLPEGLGGFGARRGRLPFPARGPVEVAFGRQVDPRFRTVTHHNGIDIRAPAGSAVHAPHHAVVGFAGPFRGYGNLVVLDHGEGYFTLYAHLDLVFVESGQRVGEGERIATVGETGSLKGPYLYFEIRSGQKPLDPAEWLAGG